MTPPLAAMPVAPLLQQTGRTHVLHGGRKLIYFAGCDYFRLASHPEVLRAFHDGTRKFGLNVAASRATTGNHALYVRLEKELSGFFHTPRAALFSNGYVTNMAFAQTFAGEYSHVLLDERSHGSLRDAATLLRCPELHFRHRDPRDLQRLLRGLGRRARPIVLTDGLFSHDGSLAPLPDYLSALPRHGLLLVDDTHGAGTLGRHGRGTAEQLGASDARMIRSITLSKAFGVYGGAILASRSVVEAIQTRSRLFIGNTPPPLPLVNAALAAVRLLKADRSLRTRLNANVSRLKNALRAAGWDAPMLDSPAPIIPVVPRDTAHARRLQRALLQAGIYPPLIRYGSGGAYFRFVLSSEHTRTQLDRLAAVLITHP